MNCELCGQKPGVYAADIEGTTMKVCVDCSRFGSNKRSANVKVVVTQKRIEEEGPDYIFIQGYGKLVKAAREKLGLKQDELAKRLNERESLLHQIESEHLKPNIMLAKKLERELKIKIVEEIKPDSSSEITKPTKRENVFTLGDMIKRR